MTLRTSSMSSACTWSMRLSSDASGSAPGWAKKSNFVGAADPNRAVGFRVYLGWNDLAGAEALARAVSDPNNASYGKYVKLKDTVRSFKEIVEGKYDDLPEQAFYMVGTIEEVVAKAEKLGVKR